MNDEILSTTRLAELLKTDGKQLFRLLQEQGWIIRDNNQWKLTAHGELEDGSYQHSEKYGDYIVWPASLAAHPLLQAGGREELSATRLGEYYGISAHCINSVFAELGWLDKDQRGWMLTELGAKNGGIQRNGKHGFFVLWPSAVRQQPLFSAMLDNVTGKQRGACLDGLLVASSGEQRINNWFYLHHIVRAYKHPVPGSAYQCTFYLPVRKVFVDYWGFDFSTGSLSEKLDRQAFYQANGLRHIELNDEDLPRLDEVLPKKLLPFGIQLHTGG